MFSSFINKIGSDKSLNKEHIIKALEFAKEAHKDQKRSSGQDYIIHPVVVATVVLKYLADTPTIIAALLHDVVEDTSVTLDVIAENFGGEVVTLVEGVTKLSKIEFRNEAQAKAENFRKFILSISKDIRILVIKLADRLHNLRTIKYIPNLKKQQTIALETLEVYVPLAERIGITTIKDELEDLSFEVLHKDFREIIIQRIENYKNIINIDLLQIRESLEDLLSKGGIKNFRLQGRIKRPYSIWNKMQKNEVDFEEINDLVAFRIILKNINNCYTALGIIHRNYKSFFSNFRDYISVAKDNSYQSIHTCVLFKPALKIELQIRTEEMHQIAENGISAHWSYKNNVKPYDMREYMWLNNILEIVNSPFLEPNEKYEYSKLEMFNNEIFVFTPKGKIISLPKGSIVLDFAYAIHTDIGNKCIGAKIDGEFFSAYHELENGSTVKAVTSEKQEPDIELIKLVKTGTALSYIKKYWRNKKKEQVEHLIKSILEYAFKKEGIEYNDNIIVKALEKYRLSTLEFYYGLLQGSITVNEIIKTFYPEHSLYTEDFSKLFIFSTDSYGSNISKYSKLYLADCCLPVKQDKIVGIISLGQTIIVHRDNCKEVRLDKNKSINRVNTEWSKKIPKNQLFLSKLFLETTDTPGVIFNIAKTFNEKNINIIEISSSSFSSSIKLLELTFEVKSLKSINQLIKEIEKYDFIKEVRRK